MSMNKARDIHTYSSTSTRQISVCFYVSQGISSQPPEHKTKVLRNCMQALWLGRTVLNDTYNESVWKQVTRWITGRNRVKKKLHDENIHKLSSLQNIIRFLKSRWVVSTRHAASIEEKWNTTEIPEYPRQFDRTRSRWLVTIKINLK